MRERQILVSGPMVRAILAGTKTMTRRVVKPQPARVVSDWSFDAEEGEHVMYHGWPHRLAESRGRDKAAAGILTPLKRKCPYGVPGDRLWVRETWGCKSADAPGVPDGRRPQPGDAIQYASNEADAWQWRVPGSLPWRPSIHMPRWASRITLEVMGVRVERVQDISEEDARAEGIPTHVAEHTFMKCYRDPAERAAERRKCFAQKWDEINAKDGRRWVDNPFVWVVTFCRIRP